VIWLNPAAWLGLVALAVPILIHILLQRRAERLPFPSLRFLQQTRLASIRRHVLEDVTLLAIRAAILAAAVAALAGPLLVTPTRRQAWNARVVQAIVLDEVGRPFSPPRQPRPFLSQTFETRSLPDGIHRALAWLDNAPPARRELVIVGPLAFGSVTADDVSAVPPAIGIRFERSGTLPEERTVDGGEVLGRADLRVRHKARLQSVILNRDRTTVTETDGSNLQSLPLEIVASSAVRPIVDAALAAVLSQRVWAPAADRRGRFVLVEASTDPAGIADAKPVTDSWAADAIASIARDHELQTAGAEVPSGFTDPRFTIAPWRPLLSASDNRPLAAAASSPSGLILVSAAEPSSLVTPLLLRALVNGLGARPDLRAAEVLPIPDPQLQAWTRPASPVAALRIDRVEQDDRRGLWALVLALLALEAWVRRTRTAGAIEPHEEARVA
jgi:hypothetical protein